MICGGSRFRRQSPERRHRLKCLLLSFLSRPFSACVDGLQSRSRKSEQDHDLSFCLTTAIVAVTRRDHESRAGTTHRLRAEGGAGRHLGDRTIAQLAEHFEVHPSQECRAEAPLAFLMRPSLAAPLLAHTLRASAPLRPKPPRRSSSAGTRAARASIRTHWRHLSGRATMTAICL